MELREKSEKGNERTADADCRGGQFDVAWNQGPLAHHNARRPNLVPENRNFLSLWKVGFTAGPSAPLRIPRRGGKTAVLASKLDFGLGLAPVRSWRAVIEAESQSEE